MNHVLNLVVQQAINKIVHKVRQRDNQAIQVLLRILTPHVLKQRSPRREAARAHVDRHQCVHEAHDAIVEIRAASSQQDEPKNNVQSCPRNRERKHAMHRRHTGLEEVVQVEGGKRGQLLCRHVDARSKRSSGQTSGARVTAHAVASLESARRRVRTE